MKTLIAIIGVCVLATVSLFSHGQGNARTTADPAVPIRHLELLLDPLTRDELATEAEAWRDLVKAKVREISAGEIATREMNEEIAATEEAADAQPAAQAQVEQQVAQQQEAKQAALDRLTALREERSALLDRMNTVLDAFAEKGGDPAEFRQYARAVSGINVEVTDTNATWSAIRGWVISAEGGIKWGLKAIQFIAIMLVFWVAARVVGTVITKVTENSQRISGLLKSFLNKFVTRTIIFVGLLVAVSTLGVKVGALLALVGGGAFIIGFALQDTLGNFAAGMMLLFYRPFDVGDIVEVGGAFGFVDQVSLVTTTIRTFDNRAVLVPNNQVWGQVITNVTANDKRRVDMIFGIGYGDDIDKAKTVIEKIVNAHELVLEDPAPTVQLHTLGESSVDFICRPWTETANYWQVYWDITQAVKKTFDAEGISIPFPQRDIHVYHEKVAGPDFELGSKSASPARERSKPAGEEFPAAETVDG